MKYKIKQFMQKIKTTISQFRIKAEYMKMGIEQFEKWNYYIFLLSIVTMYLTIHIFTYLDILSFDYRIVIDYDEYQNFLEKIFYFGIGFAGLFSLFYIYTILTYMFYYLKKDKVYIDALIVNFFYFLILVSNLHYYNYDKDYIYYFSFLLFVPILIYINFICKEKNIHIKSIFETSKRIFLILIFTFLIDNSNNFITSYFLIKKDIEQNVFKHFEDRKNYFLPPHTPLAVQNPLDHSNTPYRH